MVGKVNNPDNLCNNKLYNVLIGIWTSTENMTYPRAGHTASVLENGNVLVASSSTGHDVLFSVELYDPSTGTWTLTGNMTYSWWDHTASVLPDGTVLVVGGMSFPFNAELY